MRRETSGEKGLSYYYKKCNITNFFTLQYMQHILVYLFIRYCHHITQFLSSPLTAKVISITSNPFLLLIRINFHPYMICPISDMTNIKTHGAKQQGLTVCMLTTSATTGFWGKLIVYYNMQAFQKCIILSPWLIQFSSLYFFSTALVLSSCMFIQLGQKSWKHVTTNTLIPEGG